MLSLQFQNLGLKNWDELGLDWRQIIDQLDTPDSCIIIHLKLKEFLNGSIYFSRAMIVEMGSLYVYVSKALFC